MPRSDQADGGAQLEHLAKPKTLRTAALIVRSGDRAACIVRRPLSPRTTLMRARFDVAAVALVASTAMVGALSMHAKVKDPSIKSLPASLMLLMAVAIVLLR